VRKEIVLLVLGVVVCLGMVVEAGIYSGGNGDPNTPYLIANADDIIEMSNTSSDWDKNFLMIADVNMVDYTFTTAVISPDVSDWSWDFDGTSFTGVFDGAGFRILNIIIDTDGAGNEFLGLFGQIGSEGEVNNLGLENISVTGGDSSECIGGLCGENSEGTIINCYATGAVIGGDGSMYLGGLCGRNCRFGTISYCYTTGAVTGGDGPRYLGGLCGENWCGTISNCYTTGAVTGGDDSERLGGLCGINGWQGMISNCYAKGIVCGGDSSSDLGGLCGDIVWGGTISNCFWDVETSGLDYSDGGEGLTTEEMMKQVSFFGWDFVGETVNGSEDIWKIVEGFDYPRLSWEPYPMEVSMKWTPQALKCHSNGKWVKAHMTLPESYYIEDVNAEIPFVLMDYGLESVYTEVFINDEDLVQINAAFDREEFCGIVEHLEQDLTVIGFLFDGNIFYGTATITRIEQD
jgi:hypothetical protein